jgi:anti-sigma regulatory factor (Ser/Thr protein kinase)
MTAHRAASPVTTEVMSVSHDWLRTPSGPAGTSHLSQARQSSPAPAAAVSMVNGSAMTQPSANCPLRSSPESVGIGRDFTRTTLLHWGMAALTDLAELVVSELLTNALRHGIPSARRLVDECPIRLKLLGQTPYLMCMVTDPGAAIPVLRESGPFAESGRGLHVVESCCVRWGWHLLDGGGKVVWALLRPDA